MSNSITVPTKERYALVEAFKFLTNSKCECTLNYHTLGLIKCKRCTAIDRVKESLSDGKQPISEPVLIEAWMKENESLRTALQSIIDNYDARSELYTNDEDLAASLAGMARAALNKIDPSQAPLDGER